MCHTTNAALLLANRWRSKTCSQLRLVFESPTQGRGSFESDKTPGPRLDFSLNKLATGSHNCGFRTH